MRAPLGLSRADRRLLISHVPPGPGACGGIVGRKPEMLADPVRVAELHLRYPGRAPRVGAEVFQGLGAPCGDDAVDHAVAESGLLHQRHGLAPPGAPAPFRDDGIAALVRPRGERDEDTGILCSAPDNVRSMGIKHPPDLLPANAVLSLAEGDAEKPLGAGAGLRQVGPEPGGPENVFGLPMEPVRRPFALRQERIALLDAGRGHHDLAFLDSSAGLVADREDHAAGVRVLPELPADNAPDGLHGSQCGLNWAWRKASPQTVTANSCKLRAATFGNPWDHTTVKAPARQGLAGPARGQTTRKPSARHRAPAPSGRCMPHPPCPRAVPLPSRRG